jgi:hypothetical protein
MADGFHRHLRWVALMALSGQVVDVILGVSYGVTSSRRRALVP